MKRNRHSLQARTLPALFGLALMLAGGTATANPELIAASSAQAIPAGNPPPQWSLSKRYALGVVRYQLDHDTRLMGWQLSDRWYFGRQKGLDSGLTLVWQRSANQVSLSKDGLRLTRRF
jgi:hypothetical protein